MKSTLLLFTVMLLAVSCPAQDADTDRLDSLSGNVIRRIRAADKKRIWLITDRDIYAGGETLYFKAWMVDSIQNRLQRQPKKLWIDLVDDSDKVSKQLLLNAATLKTSGSISLGESLKQGYYWLRAYTGEMAGGNAQDAGIVPVYIINKNKQPAIDLADENKPAAGTAHPVIEIFPEGGSIISGISTAVAVKTTDGQGKPAALTITVKDNHDNAITRFTTNGQGLGKFSFYPKWFNKYTLHFNFGKESDMSVPLPPINFFAAQVAIERQSEDYIVARIGLEDSLYANDFVTYLLGVSGDSLCFAGKGKGDYNAAIPLRDFPAGIAKLLLFNRQQQLLSERAVYINKKGSNLYLTTDKEKYNRRENVQLTIAVNDANNQPVLSSLAIAVTDSRIADTAVQLSFDDTLSQLSPADADLQMLVGGNSYRELLSRTVTKQMMPYPETDSFLISGRVLNKKNQPAAGQVITVLTSKKMFFLDTDTTNAKGTFRFALPDFSDGKPFSIQVSDAKGRKAEGYNVILDSAQQPHFLTPPTLRKKINFPDRMQTIASFFADSFFIVSGKEYLKPVIVKTYKKKEIRYDASKRLSNFSHIITQDMIGSGANMAGNALLMIPGVHLFGGYVMIGGPSDFKLSAGNEPIVVLDGVRVSLNGDSLTSSPVLNFLNSIPFRTIDFIEVLTGAEGAIYGATGGNGVILVNTKSGPEANPEITALQSFYPQGFHTTTPFAMPDYTNAAIKKSAGTDARTTLYWNGDLLTDKDGKATVHFFTADAATDYIVTVTGITANGCLLHETMRIQRR